MATYSKELLSGSTNGKGIKVAATSIASSPTTIHTAVTGTTDIDLVTLFAYNSDSADRVLTIGWGGTTDPDDRIIVTIPPQAGRVPIVVNEPLQNGLVISAACPTANVIIISGYVNRVDK